MGYTATDICFFCNKKLKDEDPVKICPVCNMSYHLDCWCNNKGCSNNECTEYHYPKEEAPFICQNCGENLEVNQLFCQNCGTPGHQLVKPSKCSKCGSELTEDQSICPACEKNKDVGININSLAAIDMINENIEKKKKSKKIRKRIRNVFIATILVIAVAIVGRSVWLNTGPRLIEKQLLLGQKYITDLNYNDAIIAFNIVLEKDSNNTAAYLGIADAYYGLDRIESAIETLETANEKIKSEEINAKLLKIKADINTCGNIAGNIINGGLVAQQSNRLYIGGSSLSKINIDGSDSIQLSNGSFQFINVVGDWIYYWNYIDDSTSEVCKIRTDGTQATKLNDDYALYMNIVGDWIYYCNVINDSTSEIIKIRKDGTEKFKLSNDNSNSIIVAGDWIYYSNDSDEGKIYKIGIDGTGRTKINDDQSLYLNVVSDWIYYCNWSDYGNLYKIRTDGTNRKMIVDDAANNINVADDWIYYCLIPNSKRYNISYNAYDDGPIYKIRTDGTERELINSNICSGINLAGDWIYYTDESSYINKIRTDGTEQQILN